MPRARARSSRREVASATGQSSSSRSTSTRIRRSPEQFAVSGDPGREGVPGRRGREASSSARSRVRPSPRSSTSCSRRRAPTTLVEELRATGELPEVVAALDADDVERALSLIVEAVPGAEPSQRERLREVAVALFERLGQDDPVASGYRRRLASALY